MIVMISKKELVRWIGNLLFLCSGLAILACGKTDEKKTARNKPAEVTPDAENPKTSDTTNQVDDKDKEKPEEPVKLDDQPIDPKCVRPEGAPVLKRATDVVAHVNMMAKPVTIPCFLDSLPRPLRFSATLATGSVQPGFGENSPRIFISVDKFILAVVPEGPGANLLEMSELTSAGRSIKSEIRFPLEKDLSAMDPYDSVYYGGGTTCGGLCHLGEIKSSDPAYGGKAYISDAIRPKKYYPFSDFTAQLELCKQQSEKTYRCSMLEVLLRGGSAIEEKLPMNFSTF